MERKTLVITEGYAERVPLLKDLCALFPELNIDYNADTIVYETNIYILYDLLAEEYDLNIDTDIDLPFVLSNANHLKQKLSKKLYKEYFTDIILCFDYEIQDPKFDPEKLMKLQELFNDSTDNGKLYLNYPMHEFFLLL